MSAEVEKIPDYVRPGANLQLSNGMTVARKGGRCSCGAAALLAVTTAERESFTVCRSCGQASPIN